MALKWKPKYRVITYRGKFVPQIKQTRFSKWRGIYPSSNWIFVGEHTNGIEYDNAEAAKKLITDYKAQQENEGKVVYETR